MGFYEREYYQDDAQRGFTLGSGGRMIVTNLVIINAVIWLADAFTQPIRAVAVQDGQLVEAVAGRWLSNLLALKISVIQEPWMFWNVLSYGFAHASLGTPNGFWHILFNMFMLWMFGRDVEMRYGAKEFLTFYLAAIVVAGAVWLGWSLGAGQERGSLVGASGGVVAVFLLFVLHNPRQTLYVWGLLAVPAWLIGAIMVLWDLMRGLSGQDSNVAWQAHLAGAAFAFLYFRFRWNLSRWLPAGWKPNLKKLQPKPRLKIHDPEQHYQQLDDEADRVLDKLHREGEESLNGRERKILEDYSRRMRQKRR
jgi:membrane associated rhomboid family serine protease